MKSLISNPVCRILLAGALTLGAGAAFAQEMMPGPDGSMSGVWTIYAFGNAQAVSDSLRAVANFCMSQMFRDMVLFLSIAGMLAVGATAGFSSGMARKFVGYIVSVMLVSYFLLGWNGQGSLVVKVDIIDTVDATWKSPITVPAIVGIPAAVISTSGFEIMKQVEASFPLPDALKMSNGAPFNMATALISDASKAKITDPNLSSSLALYVQDCFIPAVARGEKNAQTLLTSTKFIDDLLFNNGAVMVNSFLPDGNAHLESCKSAHALIATAVNTGGTAADYLKSASAWTSTPALSVVNTVADSVAQYASNNGYTDGGGMVKQAAVLASFTGAFSQAAAQTGNSDFLTGLAITQAHESQVASWVVGAEIFNRSMGYILAVLQVFVYAITPLILAAAVIPSLGLSLLKNWVQILLWMAIWQPMLAIVNFVIISMQSADLGGIMSNGSDQFGFTLANMGIISEKSSNMRAAATFVGTMVPALAWAMVKGAIDVSRIIGSAVGENFSQSAANTMTTGNYSLNSASMDSFTANKHSIASSFDAGKGMSMSGTGGVTAKTDTGGNAAVDVAGESNRTQLSATEAASRQRQMASSLNKSEGGSSAVNANRTDAVVQNSNQGQGVTKMENSNTGDTASAVAAASTGVAVRKAGGGATGSRPGDGFGADGSTPAPAKIGSAPSALQPSADLRGTLQVGMNAAHTKGNAFQDNIMTGSGGSRTTAGSDLESKTKAVMAGENVTRSESSSSDMRETTTTITPSAIRAANNRAALEGNFNRYGPGSVGQAPATPMEQRINDLQVPGAIPAAAAKVDDKVASKEEALGKEKTQLEHNAAVNKAGASGAAAAQLAAHQAALDARKPAAQTTALQHAAKGAADVGSAVVGAVKAGASKIADLATDPRVAAAMATAAEGGMGAPGMPVSFPHGAMPANSVGQQSLEQAPPGAPAPITPGAPGTLPPGVPAPGAPSVPAQGPGAPGVPAQGPGAAAQLGVQQVAPVVGVGPAQAVNRPAPMMPPPAAQPMPAPAPLQAQSGALAAPVNPAQPAVPTARQAAPVAHDVPQQAPVPLLQQQMLETPSSLQATPAMPPPPALPAASVDVVHHTYQPATTAGGGAPANTLQPPRKYSGDSEEAPRRKPDDEPAPRREAAGTHDQLAGNGQPAGFGVGMMAPAPAPAPSGGGGGLAPRAAASSSNAQVPDEHETKPGMPKQTTGSSRAPE